MTKPNEAAVQLAIAAQWLKEAAMSTTDRYLKWNLERTADNCAEVARKMEGR